MSNLDYKDDIEKVWSDQLLIHELKKAVIELRDKSYGKQAHQRTKMAKEILPFFSILKVPLHPGRRTLATREDKSAFLADVISGIKPNLESDQPSKGKRLGAVLLAWMACYHERRARSLYASFERALRSQITEEYQQSFILPFRAFETKGTVLEGAGDKTVPPQSSTGARFLNSQDEIVFVLFVGVVAGFREVQYPRELHTTYHTGSDANWLNNAHERLADYGIKSRFELIETSDIPSDFESILRALGKHTIVVFPLNGKLLRDLSRRSSEQSRQFFEAISGSKNVFPVYCGLSPRQRVTYSSLFQPAPINLSEEVLETLADTLARAVFHLRQGDDAFGGFQVSAIEKDKGKAALVDELPRKISKKRRGKSAFIGMIDLDKLTQINRRFGPEVGDVIIDKLPALIEEKLDGRRHICGRCGDDTFYVVVFEEPKTSAKSAGARFDELRAHLSNFGWARIAHGLSVSCSIGFAEVRKEERIIYTILRAAVAMNRAQSDGGNRTEFAPIALPGELYRGNPLDHLSRMFS